MILEAPSKPICLPPAPLNGGKLETAPPKVGQWAWQPKIDDWRGIVHTPTLTVWNQYGQLSSVAERGHLGIALAHLCGPNAPRSGVIWPDWLDIGIMQNRHDMMRGSIVVLDGVSDLPFADRREVLEAMFPIMPLATIMVGRRDLAHNRVYLIPQVIGEEKGRQLYDDLKLQNNALNRKFYEGVVCKKLSSTYPMVQRAKSTTAGWIKHRFDQ